MVLRVELTPIGWEDYCHWVEADPDIVVRIHELIKDIGRDPFKGLGKPEPLRHDLAGFWSRRITVNTAWSMPLAGKRRSAR